jgi:hypothetical protein
LVAVHCIAAETRALSLDKPAAQGKNQGMAAVEKQFEGYVISDPEILGGEPVLVGTRRRLMLSAMQTVQRPAR